MPSRSADYAHALQFVDWSPSDAMGSHALAEYLYHQLQLAKSLMGEPQLHHTRALTFTIEQLRLPMLDPILSERPMAAVHEWCSFAMQTVAVTEELWAQRQRKNRSSRRAQESPAVVKQRRR